MDMRPDDNLYKIYANKIKKKLASKQIQTSDMFLHIITENLNNNNSVDEKRLL